MAQGRIAEGAPPQLRTPEKIARVYLLADPVDTRPSTAQRRLLEALRDWSC
jgi:hypothetical protein